MEKEEKDKEEKNEFKDLIKEMLIGYFIYDENDEKGKKLSEITDDQAEKCWKTTGWNGEKYTYIDSHMSKEFNEDLYRLNALNDIIRENREVLSKRFFSIGELIEDLKNGLTENELKNLIKFEKDRGENFKKSELERIMEKGILQGLKEIGIKKMDMKKDEISDPFTRF